MVSCANISEGAKQRSCDSDTFSPPLMVQELKPMETKYGPLTIHQKGVAVKQLAATQTDGKTHTFDKVRLSFHLERFESAEKLNADVKCFIRIPECGYEQEHNATCEMRVGQTHGAAVVAAPVIKLDFDKAEDTQMIVEFKLGEESLAIVEVPIKFAPTEE